MLTGSTSPEENNRSLLVAGLIKQLEEERQRLAGEVDRLEVALEAERNRNAAEWRQFFQDASLTNTVTGEAIRNLDDFRVWKSQFDALRHIQETNPTVPPVAPSPQQRTISTVPSSASKQPASRSPSNLVKRLLPWAFTVCIITSFIVLCVFYRPDASSIGSANDLTPSELVNSSSYAVDYETRYVGSINSDFVHLATCRHAENILEENRIYYKSVADAVSDGRSKCSTCLGASEAGTASGSNSESNTSYWKEDSAANDFTRRYLELRKQREDSPPPFFK